jgi:hypothetical protein
VNTSKRKTDFSEWEWKWRLDECLRFVDFGYCFSLAPLLTADVFPCRFAAELAGRSALRDTHEGLALEMKGGAW